VRKQLQQDDLNFDWVIATHHATPAGMGCCFMATIGVGESNTAVEIPLNKRSTASKQMR
jgi:hypothetical protein